MLARRHLLAAAASHPLLALPAIGQERVRLRISWWGNDARHRMQNQLVDLWTAANPGIVVEREFASYDAYLRRLATQAAGNNMPDVVMTHPNFVSSYAERRQLLPLDDYVRAARIDLSDFTPEAVEAGKYGGRQLGITLGLSPRIMAYNPRLFREAGITPPHNGWTWAEWAEKAVAINRALGARGVFGVADQAADEVPIDTFMGQRGRNTFSPTGLAFDKPDLRAFWGMWEQLRAAGGLPRADQATEMNTINSNHADSLLSRGRLATWITPGNQFKLFQRHAQDELDLVEIPLQTGPGTRPYNFASGAFLAISARSRNPDAAADLINFWVNDPQAGLVFNGENGRPGSRRIAALLEPQLVPADRKLYAFQARVADQLMIDPPQPPQAANIRRALERAYETLRFGRRGLDASVDAFFAEAEAILRRS